MITSVDEFLSLCASGKLVDINRSLQDEASIEIWMELVSNFSPHQIDVAQNRTIPPEIMRILATQGDEVVRTILAEKRKLPVDIFGLLANDSSELVRKKIAANQKTPIEIVENLANDENEDVSRVAKFRLSSRS